MRGCGDDLDDDASTAQDSLHPGPLIDPRPTRKDITSHGGTACEQHTVLYLHFTTKDNNTSLYPYRKSCTLAGGFKQVRPIGWPPNSKATRINDGALFTVAILVYLFGFRSCWRLIATRTVVCVSYQHTLQIDWYATTTGQGQHQHQRRTPFFARITSRPTDRPATKWIEIPCFGRHNAVPTERLPGSLGYPASCQTCSQPED